MNKIMLKRTTVIVYIFIISFIVILLRLGYVQVFNGEVFIERAFELWTRNIPVQAKRGRIFDRNGKLIVGNTLAPTVMIIPSQIEDKEYAINTLASILEVERSLLVKHFEKNVSVEAIKPAGRNITLEQAKLLISKDIKGVYVAGDTIRYYPYGDTLSHVLGIVGVDNQGITGVEYIYDSYLLGNNGSENIYTDAHGNLYDNLTGTYSSSTAGLDIYLTIDIDIQLSLERVLNNSESEYQVDEAIGIVMNPMTSEIYAMASRPNFEIDNYQEYDQTLYNRNLAIWKSFEPGSTFKICTFAAGLEEKVFSLDERFYDPGFSIIDGTRIRDWKAGGHGDETFLEVLQNSCNPGFMEIGMRLGKDILFNYIRSFGYGEKTGIDLLGESTGILFNEEKIGNVELATASFGQGNSVTAIQLLNAASAAVNGGNLNTPYILKGFGIDSTIIFQTTTKFKRKVISEETSQVVASSLEHVVALGTGRGAYIDGYRVGGKTGTAQIAENGKYLENQYILSFLGIAPMNNPSVACYIAVNNAKTYIQYGGTVVAPMVKEVLSESFQILNIPPQTGQIERESRWWVDKFIYVVDDYIGQDISRITINPYYKFKIIGSGSTIIAQSPGAGEKIIQDGYVTLYT